MSSFFAQAWCLAQEGRAEELQGLLQRGPPDTAFTDFLHVAILNDHAPTVAVLLQAKACPDDLLPSGDTAVFLAASTGNVAALEVLASAKAKLDAGICLQVTLHFGDQAIGAPFIFSESPIERAERNGHRQAVQMLLSAKADAGNSQLCRDSSSKPQHSS
jgi:ankyrin repeat protein